MMTYKKARSIQSIVIFTVVILAGTVLSVVSRVNRKGEVEGIQDESSVSELNSIPVFKSEAPINGYVGEIYSYYVTVSDSDSSDLVLSISKGPVWLNVDGLEVYGVPFEETSEGGEKVVLKISDGINSGYQTFYLNISLRDETK
jgi:hypothetical protein